MLMVLKEGCAVRLEPEPLTGHKPAKSKNDLKKR